MTEQEINDMWKSACNDATGSTADLVITFARLIAAKQKERDAQICEEMIDTTTRSQYVTQAECKTVLNSFVKCAAAIREQT